jgi:hypothetical protein
MATGNSARVLSTQQVHYLRKTVAFNTSGIATGVKMPAQLPVGAMIISTTARIKTGFNSAGTNRLVVGTNSSSFNNMMTSTVAAASTTGGKQSVVGAALSFTQPTDVYVKYTAATGTAATAGEATIVVAYTVDNYG